MGRVAGWAGERTSVLAPVLAPKLRLGLSVRLSRPDPGPAEAACRATTPADLVPAAPPPASGCCGLGTVPGPASRQHQAGPDLAALATITATRSSKARGPDLRVAIAKPAAALAG
jgi:hypothetical protein